MKTQGPKVRRATKSVIQTWRKKSPFNSPCRIKSLGMLARKAMDHRQKISPPGCTKTIHGTNGCLSPSLTLMTAPQVKFYMYENFGIFMTNGLRLGHCGLRSASFERSQDC